MPAGNVIFATRVGVGKVAINAIDLAISQDLTGILVDNGRVWPPFLVYQLRTDQVQRYVEQHKRGATIKGVPQSCLRDLELFLPEMRVQRRIAAILTVVQRAIEQQERVTSLTTELKRTLTHKLFTEGTRGEAKKQTEIGPVPKSWDVVRLDRAAEIERGKFSHRPRNDPKFYGGRHPFIQTGDVSGCDGLIQNYSQTLNDNGLAISKNFPAGTILITIAANIGFTGILTFDAACPDSLIGLSPLADFDARFLNYFLMTQQPEMDRLAPRGTQKNINIEFLKPWPTPKPSLDEQRDIADTLDKIVAKAAQHKKKCDAFQAIFHTLLHQLMTAQLRVDKVDVSELKALGIQVD